MARWGAIAGSRPAHDVRVADLMGLAIGADCGTVTLESAGPVQPAVVISVLTLAVGLGGAYVTFET